MSTIQPISECQRDQVRLATHACIRAAASLFGCELPLLPLVFDLSGRSAGMYVAGRGERRIRYNPYIFAKYFEDNLRTTVPHEVAHYVTDVRHGLHAIRPHGREWREIMQALGAEPRATGSYDLAGIPVRRQRRFPYACACGQHALTTRRHNNICKGRANYYCRVCRARLVFAGPGAT